MKWMVIMKKSLILIVATLALVVFSTPLRADVIDSLIVDHEVTAGNFFGINARAMAMGQTGIATALDGSAMIYNPANLARIRRLEVLGGISHLRLENTTDSEPDSGFTSLAHVGGRDLTKTQLNALSVAVPAPTYRGSLVFGFGVHRVKNFTRTQELILDEVRGADEYIDESNKEQSLQSWLSCFEKKIILKTLEEHSWNRGKTARTLQIHYRSLLRKMKKYSIQ